MSTIGRLIGVFLLLIGNTQSFRQYSIEKDFFQGFKAGEFSIYDQTGKFLLYRFQSRYALSQTGDIYAYPSKQKVASLTNHLSPWIYTADIQVYDPFVNQWIFGQIGQAHPGYSFRYWIQYGNRRLIMEHRFLSLTIDIRDEQQINQILARITIRLSSFIWSNKYDLQVYTNEYPDIIYILGTIAFDYSSRRKITGRLNSN